MAHLSGAIGRKTFPIKSAELPKILDTADSTPGPVKEETACA